MNGSPTGFFEATPRILAASVKGAANRAENAHRASAWRAWMTAALGRIDRMPSLESLLGSSSRQPTKPRQQTWQDQLASASAWVATL